MARLITAVDRVEPFLGQIPVSRPVTRNLDSANGDSLSHPGKSSASFERAPVWCGSTFALSGYSAPFRAVGLCWLQQILEREAGGNVRVKADLRISGPRWVGAIGPRLAEDRLIKRCVRRGPCVSCVYIRAGLKRGMGGLQADDQLDVHLRKPAALEGIVPETLRCFVQVGTPS